MAVDWNTVSDAIRLGKTGRANEALQLLFSLESACESDSDRAGMSLAQSMCFAHLGQLAEAFAYIKRAKQLAGTQREFMLQIELAEADNYVLNSEYRTACELYERIALTYADLLAADPESAQELDERYGYALFHVQRYEDATSILQRLLRSNGVEDEQRVRLYLGAALVELGHSGEARREFEIAAKGPNAKLSKDATEWLCTLANSVQ
jgi:tetratricopeptide (TPR) repeat protein